MATAIPSIACLGVIGRSNNPLHISIFPSHDPLTNTLTPIRTPLQFSLLLSSTLDIFDLRAKHSASAANLSGDYGLLHAVDERLAAYGFETNTGVKFVVVVDMRGRRVAGLEAGAVGLKESDLKVVFRAMSTAYVRLLQNPFYEPEESGGAGGGRGIGGKKFGAEMRRIGEAWTVGVTSL
ncbi:hypothetical protein N0V93_000833 [Gnomoniopsis smithogilvyi]|uniref:Trafficking protein particle complex subunit 2-like protein n=1 Tax=Gnomoniopsis smithogilvyi TaxID=1191159 RepID=A0A9W8Z4R4_9PEZI|nr:hypothetical protein N0V93_000833 [Gnomoniopsis smithogilvyi]